MKILHNFDVFVSPGEVIRVPWSRCLHSFDTPVALDAGKPLERTAVAVGATKSYPIPAWQEPDRDEAQSMSERQIFVLAKT
jgi:hypothetical protein